MATGKIKWFNKDKGFGFIATDERGDEIFFHCNNVEMPDDGNLKEGQKVSFLVEQGRKGLEALDVKLL